MTDIYNMQKRACGDCSKCCEGWLSDTIRGHAMYPGKSCHYLTNSTCTIYKDRPETPCQVYNCAWIEDETFPSWLKPSLTNVIISKKVPDNKNLIYYDVTETGVKIDSVVLNWIIQWAIANSKNIIYTVDSKKYMIGTLEFTQAVHALQNK